MKKRIFLTVFLPIFALIILLGALPFILTSQWAVRKYMLPVAEKKMQCSITSEKINFSLFDPGRRLVFSGVTVSRKTGKEKEQLLIGKAKEVRINFPLKSIFSFRKYGVNSLSVRELSILYYPQENAEGIKQFFDSLFVEGGYEDEIYESDYIQPSDGNVKK